MRLFLRIVGIGLTCASGFFIVSAIADLLGGGDGKTSKGVLLGLVVFFGGVAFTGIHLYRANRRVPTADDTTPELEREQRILLLAESQGGRVTLAEVAAHCHMSVADSKRELERLATSGVAELQFVDGGTTFVYLFPGFMTAEAKASARSTPL